MDTPTLSALTERDRADFVEVMSRAFAVDPWYVALFGPNSPASERRRREFFAFLFDLSLWTGSEVRGLRHAGRLVGAYILDAPETQGRAWPRVVARAVTEPIGLSWRNARLITTYLRHTRAALPRGRTHYLALIAVDAGLRGRGFGRLMLDDVVARVDEDPRALGIGLDTENADNVGLYQRFGFALTATTVVGPVSVHCLFRPSPRERR